LPTLTPFGISWVVAERYVYLGSIGVVFVIGYFFNWLIKKNKVIGYLLFVICILGLMTRTIIRNMDWKNEDTLWLSMKDISSADPKTHNNLGDMYGRHGDFKKAEEEFKKAIAINPNYGDAYHNLGNTYLQTERLELAIQSYEKAASINPNLWQSYQNISAIYFKQKKFDKALEYMEKAVKVNPQNDNLYLNTSIIYVELRDLTNAKRFIDKTLQINPDNEKAKQLLPIIIRGL
jgi:tetratricopeptide (TPR) repeat protein